DYRRGPDTRVAGATARVLGDAAGAARSQSTTPATGMPCHGGTAERRPRRRGHGDAADAAIRGIGGMPWMPWTSRRRWPWSVRSTSTTLCYEASACLAFSSCSFTALRAVPPGTVRVSADD